MTLNAVIPYFAFFLPNSVDFHSDYGWRQTYNVCKILSPSSSLSLFAKTITHPAALSLGDSWASCRVHCQCWINVPLQNLNRICGLSSRLPVTNHFFSFIAIAVGQLTKCCPCTWWSFLWTCTWRHCIHWTDLGIYCRFPIDLGWCQHSAV